MSNKWRRFFHFSSMTDAMFRRIGRRKPSWKLSIILERQNETQRVEGHWRSSGILYRDNLARPVVDVPDAVKNRR